MAINGNEFLDSESTENTHCIRYVIVIKMSCNVRHTTTSTNRTTNAFGTSRYFPQARLEEALVIMGPDPVEVARIEAEKAAALEAASTAEPEETPTKTKKGKKSSSKAKKPKDEPEEPQVDYQAETFFFLLSGGAVQ